MLHFVVVMFEVDLAGLISAMWHHTLGGIKSIQRWNVANRKIAKCAVYVPEQISIVCDHAVLRYMKESNTSPI